MQDAGCLKALWQIYKDHLTEMDFANDELRNKTRYRVDNDCLAALFGHCFSRQYVNNIHICESLFNDLYVFQ